MAKTAVAELALDRSASHLLHRALQLALDIYGAETGPGAVTQRQFAVLAAAAARDGCTQSDLVKATGIDRSTLAELVGRLTTRGLIARERSTSDGRILGLLPAGKRDSFLKILREMGRPPEPKAKKIKAEKADKAEKKKKKKAKKAKRHEGAGEAAVV
jgi:MarR family transcriptional regulator, temperature-dependent positive regulator of motility